MCFGILAEGRKILYPAQRNFLRPIPLPLGTSDRASHATLAQRRGFEA